ncbi:hypothetical protein ACG3SL_01255 [Sphingomonas sp. CJ20]
MRAAAVLFPAALALAGCGGAPEGAALQKQEQARAADLGAVSGWARAFQPDVAVSAANQFGFRAAPYAPAKQGFVSIGGPVTIANSFAPKPNQVAFAARGAAADKVDSIAFTLLIDDAKSADQARTRTADLVRDYLFQSKIDAKPIHAAIETGAPVKGDLAGTSYAIESDARHLTVTFTRTGATPPANS